MKAIIAINNKGFIGKDGKLPWKCSADFRHFQKLTRGSYRTQIDPTSRHDRGPNILLIGSTTFEKDLNCKRLPDRKMYIIGKDYRSMSDAVRTAYVLQDFSAELYNIKPEIWVIGGASIYTQLLPFIEEFHVSLIDDDTEGDTKFEIPKEFRGEIFRYNFTPDSKLV